MKTIACVLIALMCGFSLSVRGQNSVDIGTINKGVYYYHTADYWAYNISTYDLTSGNVTMNVEGDGRYYEVNVNDFYYWELSTSSGLSTTVVASPGNNSALLLSGVTYELNIHLYECTDHYSFSECYDEDNWWYNDNLSLPALTILLEPVNEGSTSGIFNPEASNIQANIYDFDGFFINDENQDVIFYQSHWETFCQEIYFGQLNSPSLNVPYSLELYEINSSKRITKELLNDNESNFLVVSSSTNTAILYGLENLNFEFLHEFDAGFSNSIIFRDVNQDNKTDVVFKSDGNLFLSLQNEMSDFQDPQVFIDLQEDIISFEFHDLNNDQVLDLILITNEGVWVAENYGAGNYAELTLVYEGSFNELSCGKFTGDEFEDISADNIVLKGNGNFGFEFELTLELDNSSFLYLDIDSDGDLDFVKKSRRSIQIMINDIGSYIDTGVLVTDHNIVSFQFIDDDNDGDLDLFYSFYDRYITAGNIPSTACHHVYDSRFQIERHENLLELLCSDQNACNYTGGTDGIVDSCVFQGDECNDQNAFTFSDTLDDNCNCVGNQIVFGCTNSNACNFEPEANTDDLSCILFGDACDDGVHDNVNDTIQADCSCQGESAVFGCTHSAAVNYDPLANADDDTCLFNPGDVDGDGVVSSSDLTIFLNFFGDSCNPCPSDIDGDGVVTSSDLVMFLSVFGLEY